MDRAAFLRDVAAAPAAIAGAATGELSPSMAVPGGAIAPYGGPAPGEGTVVREPPGATMVAFAPLGRLTGAITPNGLFFTRNHAGVAAVDRATHRLLVHGRVRNPIVLSMDDLMRLPSQTRTYFIECSGNGEIEWQGPRATSVAQSHGLASCAEWTGVPLRVVLDAAGLERDAAWILAEGADGAGYTRSFPVAKALDDTLLVYAQNGEMLRPEQGYPLRLVLPGYEGNTHVKWLRRLEIGAAPFGERERTRYAELLRDGTSRVDDFVMRTKSVVTFPSPGDRVRPGACELRGLAWSGRGAIARIDVTLDGGASWTPATLQPPVLPKAFTRFTMPFAWDGAPRRIASRATDESGEVQPTRKALVTERGVFSQWHYNAIQYWSIAADGSVANASSHA